MIPGKEGPCCSSPVCSGSCPRCCCWVHATRKVPLNGPASRWTMPPNQPRTPSIHPARRRRPGVLSTEQPNDLSVYRLDATTRDHLDRVLDDRPPDGGLWTGQLIAQWSCGHFGS